MVDIVQHHQFHLPNISPVLAGCHQANQRFQTHTQTFRSLVTCECIACSTYHGAYFLMVCKCSLVYATISTSMQYHLVWLYTEFGDLNSFFSQCHMEIGLSWLAVGAPRVVNQLCLILYRNYIVQLMCLVSSVEKKYYVSAYLRHTREELFL